MKKILELVDLNYKDFNNINLSFNSNSLYLIVGCSNSGKTTLFKVLSSLIPTNNMVICNNVLLNDSSTYEYIKNIGIVERLNDKSFIYQRVIDEMKYPLYNLGYNKDFIMKRIEEVLELFNVKYFLNKEINELSSQEKQLLLIIISILHKPSVLLLDSVIESFSVSEQNRIIKTLKKLIHEGLTVICFTKSLDLISESNVLILIDNFSIIGEYLPSKVYEDDKLFYSHNLEIPFLTDLSIKLKMYNLISKNYYDMKEMVDDLWP